MNTQEVINKFHEDMKHGEYYTLFYKYLGIERFFIGERILGPEQSWIGHKLTEFLAQNPQLYKGKDVLDIGTGSGIQGIITKIHGAKKVMLTDITTDATRNAYRNITEMNLTNVDYKISDLFTKIFKKYDVIIFNHPFMNDNPKNPIEKIYKINKKTLDIFFTEAKDYMNKDGIIIMPFPDFCDHNPATYAKEFGYEIMRQSVIDNEHGKNRIFTLRPKIEIDARQSQLLDHLGREHPPL
ncbi:MAG: methyltransferase [archaeon]